VAESIQKKLDRVRPPRVQITYDVEIGDAIQMKELPFVMGIMADLGGKSLVDPGKVKDRRFVEIDRDNFNDIMASIAPRMEAAVPNKLSGEEGGKMKVELDFKHIDDFEPMSVINQNEPLRKLYESRRRLADLLTKLDGNDDLEALLADVVNNSDGMSEIATATGHTEE
jgi:type VI secretion system protein ImpB